MFDLKAAGQPDQAKAAPDQLWLISMASLHERVGRFDSNPARQTAPFTCHVIALGHLQQRARYTHSSANPRALRNLLGIPPQKSEFTRRFLNGHQNHAQLPDQYLFNFQLWGHAA